MGRKTVASLVTVLVLLAGLFLMVKCPHGGSSQSRLKGSETISAFDALAKDLLAPKKNTELLILATEVRRTQRLRRN